MLADTKLRSLKAKAKLYRVGSHNDAPARWIPVGWG